jgi:hypothetical protein
MSLVEGQLYHGALHLTYCLRLKLTLRTAKHSDCVRESRRVEAETL